MKEIYARAPWYLERPEPEALWAGVLQRREAPRGPAARSALTFALLTESRRLDVYAANVEIKLAHFIECQVIARGKLVDLSLEGHGKELWLASIAAAGL